MNARREEILSQTAPGALQVFAETARMKVGSERRRLPRPGPMVKGWRTRDAFIHEIPLQLHNLPRDVQNVCCRG